MTRDDVRVGDRCTWRGLKGKTASVIVIELDEESFEMEAAGGCPAGVIVAWPGEYAAEAYVFLDQLELVERAGA